jgi:lipopolysaccharide export system protein LptC
MADSMRTWPLNLWRQVLRVWDWASIYLPVIIMATIALGTYWLVRNAPEITAAKTPRAAGHEVDYFMRKFNVKSFNEKGQLKSEVSGVEARHYADTDTLEIDQARIQSLSDSGRLVVSTANRALSNADVSQVQLSGNARVVREAAEGANGQAVPRLEFQGEFLHAYVNEERVTSNKPVVLIRGGDQFTAETFSYDSLSGVADLKGRVRAQLMPGGAAQSPKPASPQ